jgi:hypothetical protein
MGSGLIYAIIVVVWIAYFLPSWLRRHDEALGSRSMARYRTAMEVVSKGTPTEIISTPEERAASRSETNRRRRNLLGALIGLFFLTLFLAFAGQLPGWLPFGFALGTLAYSAHLRRLAVATAVQARRQDAVQRATRATASTTARNDLLLTAARSAPKTQPLLPPVISEPTGAVTVMRPSQSGWQPVEVPLPTYVTAPKAVRSHRVIDLTRPGAWSEAQKIAEEERLAAVAPSRDEVFDQIAAEEAIRQVEQFKDRAANE